LLGFSSASNPGFFGLRIAIPGGNNHTLSIRNADKQELMSYLVTGAAGFIGFHAARRLLEAGEQVIGIDNLNDYYSVELKHDRLSILAGHKNFQFFKADLSDFGALKQALADKKIRKVVHLAAQAGVRHSIEHPHAYMQSNLVGHLNVLEFCRHHDAFEGMVYASSSSVYGGNTKMPFSESDRVDTPISLYAATKKADELISHTYAHLYGMPLIGLRFFTVYGPWGRPDMAMWLFTQAILAGKAIKVFNFGKMKRDFTFIDDIVEGVLMTAREPERGLKSGERHRVYNIGNNKPEELMQMIAMLEKAIGAKAKTEMLPIQPGDVPESFADIDAIRRDYGFEPKTPISAGIPAFVDWYRTYQAQGLEALART
jgi:UDP-glucuronate 4-epimerase